MREGPFFLFTFLVILYIIVIAGITYTNSRYRLPVTLVFLVYTAYFGNVLLHKVFNRHMLDNTG